MGIFTISKVTILILIVTEVSKDTNMDSYSW